MREKFSGSVAAVVLAGGVSARMGRDKAFMPWGGQPLLQRQIQTVRDAGVEKIWISGRPGVDYAAWGCPVLSDDRENAGPIAGVAATLRAAVKDHAWLVVLAVDLPKMTPVYLRGLMARAVREGCGIIPQSGPNFEPLAAIYLVPPTLKVVEAQLAAGNYALQKMAATLVGARQAMALPLAETERDLFVNWNSPADVGQT
jgi:molybdopterin-guanine dinucleotide biosynthesis protein A